MGHSLNDSRNGVASFPTCPECSHAIRGNFPRCIYCGWSKDSALEEATSAGRIYERTFRCGATLWPFIFSGVFLGGMSIVLGCVAIDRGVWDRTGIILGILAAGLLVIGPLAAVAQVIRRRLLRVRIDPRSGIELHGSRLIPWKNVSVVARYPGPFGAIEAILRDGNRVGALFLAPHVLLAICLIAIFAVMSPWHPRVTITLSAGEKITLHDLEDSETFTRLVRYKIA